MKKIVTLCLLLLAGLQTTFAQQYDMKVWRNGTFTQFFVNAVDSVSYSKLVESIQLTPETIELEVGQTCQLTISILPEDAGEKALEWQSSAIVSVSETGLVTANYKGTGFVRCYAADGSGVSAQCQVTVTGSAGEDPEEHEYVDLGLPSGTLWATCNVGASSPWEPGLHFAWGETSPKDEYTLENYSLYDNETGEWLTYQTDGQTELLPEDDAATANWGEDWQMPSYEQFVELINEEYTTSEYNSLNGVYGYIFASKINGKSIFLPTAGFYLPDGYQDWGSFYWTRTLGEDIIWGCSYSSGQMEDNEGRIYGFSVRPVRKQ
ncbi:MAG: Ig-like domain-containing protein [Bacteroidaceae bacterium]|nr:Ig-like domain-containing protein [Bacteroidaceae bacterium]